MLITKPTDLLQRRRAYHESGHAAAVLTFGIPVIDATISGDRAYMLRDYYCAPTAGIGIETMATLCLAGPSSEEFFVGKFNDGSDTGDLAQAREVLARQFDAMQIGAALNRYRDAADKLVRTPWAQQRIRLIADALLRHGSLTGDEIGIMIAADA